MANVDDETQRTLNTWYIGLLIVLVIAGWVYYSNRVNNLEDDLSTTCMQLVGAGGLKYETAQQIAPWCTDERMKGLLLPPASS